MRKTARLIALFGIGCIGILAGCSNTDSSTSPTSSVGSTNTSSSTVVSNDFYVSYKGEEVLSGASYTIDVDDPVARLTCYNLETGADVTSTTASFSSSNSSVLTVDANGMLTALTPGSATITVTSSSSAEYSLEINFTVQNTTVASGVNSYSTVDYDEKANILGVLENYAVDNYLTGITLFSNGGYVVYNSRYQPTPTEYVSGYGWGTMREGRLSGDISNPAEGHDASYYQVGTTAVASHANAMDASGSDVSDIASYFTTSYFSNRLNATSDGYEWYPSLSTDDRPVAVDDDGNVISSNYNRRWRIHLRTASNGDNVPVYRTASTVTNYNGYNISALDGKEVELSDYLTPFKFMLTAYNGQYRGSELTDGVSGFSGAASYYNSTTDDPGDGSIYDEEAWANLMGDEETGLLPNGERGNIIVGTDDQGDYIEFNLLYPCTEFYAMYYLSSSLYSPLPLDYVEAIGADYLGAFPNNYTPVDTMVYTGPYYVEQWDNASYIKLTRNDQYYEYIEGYSMSDGNTTWPYQIPGFEFTYYESSNLQNLFETGTIDSYSPSADILNTTYNTDNGTTSSGVSWNKYQTQGDANFKINVNSTTAEQWDSYFGVNGSVTAHDSATSAEWIEEREARAYLSDKNFLDFLSFALDRETICTSRGTQPTQDYFSDNYLIDPENGISYNSTDAHAAVLADRHNDTYGYSPDDAKASLEEAMWDTIIPLAQEGLLPATGTGIAGTSSNPYLVQIDMNWMNTTDVSDYGDVFNSIENAFEELINEEFAGAYKLEINQINGTSNYQDVYDMMKEGTYDLGFGAISGGDLNPINFFEVLKSDNSSGFTLNWGADTSKVSSDIVYDGHTWSFDGLWQAADSAALLTSDGEFAEASNVSTGNTTSSVAYESINNSDMSVTYRISFKDLVNAGAKSLSVTWTNGDTSDSYTNAELEALWDSDYEVDITIDNSFNTYRNVTLRVSFTITITDTSGDAYDTETSSSISLLSYYGITGNN